MNMFLPETLYWHHNERDGISNHQLHDCLLNHLFTCRSKKTSKLHITGLCEGNSPVTGEFPAQRASNAENVSIWWRHHDQFWPLGIVVACLCVCQSPVCTHDNSWPVQAGITKFGPEGAKHIDCFQGESSLTFKVKINFEVKFYPILSLTFVRTTTRHLFKLGSQNFDQRYKTTWLRSLLVLKCLFSKEIIHILTLILLSLISWHPMISTINQHWCKYWHQTCIRP